MTTPKRGGKGPSKGGKGGSAPPMPSKLIGLSPSSPSGQFLCFGFNMKSGCPHAEAGGRCRKGMHLCMVPGCGKSHPAYRHE